MASDADQEIKTAATRHPLGEANRVLAARLKAAEQVRAGRLAQAAAAKRREDSAVTVTSTTTEPEIKRR